MMCRREIWASDLTLQQHSYECLYFKDRQSRIYAYTVINVTV